MNPQDDQSHADLLAENQELRWQLEEAHENIYAIRSGQIDALVVHHDEGPQLYSLKTADQAYRVFIEQMSEGALTLSETGIILYCNTSFAAMVNAPASKVIGQEMRRFVPQNCHADFESLLLQAKDGIRKEMPIIAGEYSVPCQISINAIALDHGEAISVIVTDLSYQKETQRQLKANNERLAAANAALERSNYDLLQFASVASHDLQEPLRKIILFADLIRQGTVHGKTGSSETQIARIMASAGRMKTLVSDILAYSRLSEGALVKEPVSLDAMFEEILEDFELLIADKNAVIQVPQCGIHVQAAKSQMRQVLQNLISNALKFSKPGVPPVVLIECAQEAEGACAIRITDNGIGFDRQYRDKIFGLFERLNTKDSYEGSGIGLAVTKKIMEQHGGQITAQSTLGEGSTFSLTLPGIAAC